MTAPPRAGLTKRQLDCLRAIEAHIAQHSYAPTFQEIAMALNLKSKGRVRALVVALAERGRIIFQKSKVRSIAVVPDPGPLYALPPELQLRLRIHCAAFGDDPDAVVADAVALHLDELGDKHDADAA